MEKEEQENLEQSLKEEENNENQNEQMVPKAEYDDLEDRYKRILAEFENFNRKIMQTDNLSLEKYKNDKVNKWTFDIIDYEVKDKSAVAVLLVKKDKLIGAYLLQMPEGTAYPLVKNQPRTDALE